MASGMESQPLFGSKKLQTNSDDQAEEFVHFDDLPKKRNWTAYLLPLTGILLCAVGVAYLLGTFLWKDGPEVLTDKWGVPHIYADSASAAAYAQGYVQASNCGNDLLRLYGEARCRAAEYWGGSRLFNDQFLLSAGLSIRATSYYNRLSPQAKEVYDAFAAGVNAYVQNNKNKIAEDALSVGQISGLDVVAYSIYASLMFAADDLPSRIGTWYQKLPGSVFTFDSTKDEEDWVYQLVQSNYRKSVDIEAGSWVKNSADEGQFKGSNAFATTRVGGGGILHINPHLSWIDPSQRLFESHTVVDSEGVNFYGASLLGLPFYFMGFNQHGGWAHTINQVTPYSLYEITLRHNPETDEDEYLYNGNWLAMEKSVYQLKIKNGGGQTFVTYSTVYGLVVARAEGRGLAFRFPGEDRTQVWEQYWGQMKAQSLEEFNQSASMMQTPMFTFIYTNRNGSLYYFSNSWTPNYRGGSYSSWTSSPYPINNDTFLWNTSDIVPFTALPQLLNPTSQFIQNANDAPWQATLPLYQPDPKQYADWISPEPAGNSNSLLSYGFRPRSQTRLLVEARNTALANYLEENGPDEPDANQTYVGISYAAAVKISMNTQVESAKHLLKPLLNLLSGYSDSVYHAAYLALSAWDGTTNPTSSGAVLFTEWLREYLSRAPTYATAFDINNPLETPFGIDSSSSSAALSAISTVASSLTNSGLSLNVTFGAVHLLPKDVNGVVWPANGECDPIGTVRAACAPLRGLRIQNVTAYAGCTWKAVIAFPPDGPIQAGVQLGYGIASQPGHKHNGDQWELFSKRQYRTPWISRTDIEANLESKMIL